MKRGLQHVEAILAFVLFMGFLLLALFFFNPFNTDRIIDSSLFYSFDEISENASVEIETFSVVINDSVSDRISIIISSDFDSARVEDRFANKLNANYEGTANKLEFDRAGNDFVIVRLGNSFGPGEQISNPQAISGGDYIVSSSGIKKAISEQRILELNKSYNEDYASVKQEFNLPGRVDFSFSLVFSENEEIVSEIFVPEGIDIFSESKRVEVIRTGGEITMADLIVSVW